MALKKQGKEKKPAMEREAAYRRGEGSTSSLQDLANRVTDKKGISRITVTRPAEPDLDTVIGTTSIKELQLTESYAQQLRERQAANRPNRVIRRPERQGEFGNGNFVSGEMPNFGPDSNDWLQGASGTFANATLFAIPNIIDQGVNLAFDWLRNGWDNIGNALGLNDVDSATLSGKMNQGLDAVQNALTGDRFYNRLVETNQQQAQEVADRSPSAAAVYPLVDTLGQIALTAGTAGMGGAVGLSDDAVRGAMIGQDFARNLGAGYEERRDDGRGFWNSLAGAALEAAPTTAIEFAGGTEALIQDAAKGGINGVSGWLERAVESAVEEAAEEIAQAPLGGLADRITGEDIPLFAEDIFDPDSEGIINLGQMRDAAGYAMLGSLIAGGAGAGLEAATENAANRPTRQMQREQRRAEREAQRAQAARQAEETEQQTPEEVALRIARGEDVERAAAIEAGAADAVADEIERYASTLGENGGKAYRQEAPRDASQTEAQAFRNAFTAYYRMGTYGKDFEEVDSSFRSFITEPEARQAFYAGQNDRAAETERASSIQQPEAAGRTGFTETAEADAVTPEAREYLDGIGKALGVEIRMEAAPVDEDGRPAYNGRVEGNTIYLSAQSENAVGDVLNHELTHVLQQRSPEEYRKYRDIVASYLDAQNPGFMQAEIGRVMDAYRREGKSITQSEAIDEIAADAATGFLTDPEAAASTVRTDRSLARKILDAIKDIVTRLKNAVRGGGAKVSQLLRESESTYRQAEEIWTRALAESAPEPRTDRQERRARRTAERQSREAEQKTRPKKSGRRQVAEDIYQEEDADIAALNAEVAEMLNAGDDEVNAEFAALRAQARILRGTSVNAEQVNRVVEEAAETYGVRDETQINKLKSVVDDAVLSMRTRGEGGFNSALASIYTSAREAVGRSEVLDNSIWDAPNVKEARDLLRTTRMYVSPDIRAGWTDWGAFRRKNTGRLRMVNDPIYTDKNGVSHEVRGVDQIYMELREIAPEFFSDEIVNPADQLEAMSDFWDAVQPVYIRQFPERGEITMEQAEAAMDLTADILSQIGGAADTSRLSERQSEALRKQVKEFEKANRALQKKYEQRSAALEKARARTKEVRADERQRSADRVQAARTKERERAAERLEAVKTHNREVRARTVERRKASTERKRIEKAAGRMTRKLEHPTDTQHIPQELRGTVADFLKTLDFSSSADNFENFAKRARPTGEDGVMGWTPTHKTLAWKALYERLDAISKAQDRNDGDAKFYAAIDPDLLPRIKELINKGAPQKIAELGAKDLSKLYKAVRAVEKGIIEIDNIRIEGQMRSATETARGIIEDTLPGWKDTGGGKLRQKASRFFKWDLMDPTRFSDLYGEHFKAVYQNLRQAENVKIEHWAELEAFFSKLKKDMKLSDRKLRKLENDYIEVSFTNHKKPVKMSRAQVMSLYLTDKREQGRKHLYSKSEGEAGGGFTLTDSKGKEVRTSYRMTPEEVKLITDNLTTEEKALADEMQQFAAKNMARWGNEASRAVYGYNKFTEAHYWPVRADPNWTRRETGVNEAQQDATIKSAGFTKALQENASNPVVIDSIFNVFSQHATQMAAYGAYLEPLEAMNKVINWNTRHDGNWRSVREAMTMAQGAEGVRYLNELLRDVNGQAKTEPETLWESLLGKAKGASVAANARVVIQQGSAIMRATYLVPQRYILMGLAGNTKTEDFFDAVPIARWKSWGYFRDGVNGSNVKELLIGKDSRVDRIIDKSMAAAGAADNITWKAIYRAVRYWTAHDMKITTGEAYQKEVQRRFTEVVDNTQVMDSIFQRPPAMRRRGLGWKMATAFMAEPLKSYNLLVGSARDMVNAAGGRRKGAAKRFAKALYAFTTSAALNALLATLVDVGRDDDDDETFIDKYWQALLGDAAWERMSGKGENVSNFDVAMSIAEGNLGQNLNPLGLVPIVKDVLSMVEGYDYELMSASNVKDVIDAATRMVKAYQDGESSKTFFEASSSFLLKLSTLSGIPINNIVRDAKAAVNFSTLFSDWDEQPGALAGKFDLYKATLRPAKNKGEYVKLLREAQTLGQDGLAKEIRDYLINEGGMSNDQIHNQLVTLVMNEEENLPLLEEYAAAYNAQDVMKMERIAKEAEKADIDGATLWDAAEKLSSNVLTGYADAYMEADEPAIAEYEAQAKRIGISSEELKEEAKDAEGDEEGRLAGVDSELEAGPDYTESWLNDALTNAILDGDSANETRIRNLLLNAGATQEEIDKSVASSLKKAMAVSMGHKGIQDMEEAGEEFDTNSTGYKILHDRYGYTQYSYSDLVEAYVSGSASYGEMLEDMLGQTSSGDNVYTEEKIEKELKSQIQEQFNKLYNWGDGSGWEPYYDALKRLGKSWDEILSSFKRSKAAKGE